MANGKADPNFVNSAFFNNATTIPPNVSAIAVSSDGGICVGGLFDNDSQGGATYQFRGLVRLGSDGTYDSNYDIQGKFNSGASVTALATIGTDVLVGGSIGSYDGVAVPPIIRLDSSGNLVSSFMANMAQDLTLSSVTKILVQLDGKVLLLASAVVIGQDASAVSRV